MADEEIRAFFAADLDDAARRAAAGVARALRESSGGDAVRWVRPEALHVTLRFLGDIDPARVEPLARAVGVRLAPLAPFEIQLGAARLFPSARRPRVVMIELAPAGTACEVAEVVLYRSELKPSGAEYTPLERVALRGGGETSTTNHP
jgi:2'-5' RNA ligase